MTLTIEERFQAFVLIYLQEYLEHLEDGDFPEFHKEWMGLVRYNRLAIAAPRSFAKSTFFSVFYPLLAVLELGKKDILLVSAASGLAEWWLGKIKRELESNISIIQTYGDLRSHIWRQDHIELKNGAVIRARGAECKLRGYRPDLVLIDDLESTETVWSETGRLKLADWFWKTLINVMNPEAQLIMIGTLLHPESLLAKILEKPPAGWHAKRYTALKEDGESIWPSKWTTRDLENRRLEIGTAAFEQEYQNNPIPDEWRTFKEETIKYFDKEPLGCAYFTTVDPAISVNTMKDPDYTAVVTCAVDSDKNIFVVDVTRKRMLPDETVDEVLRHYEEHNSDVVGIETVGFQKVLKFAIDEECNRRGIHPFIKEITTGGMRKRYRIERLQPYFEKGKVFFKASMEELKTELLSFPTGKHDDMIDALASQLELIHRGAKIKERLPEGSFDAWWNDFKRRRKSKSIRSGTWGNHKLRGTH